MVPVKLHLRNFMSYRGADNAIDFSGIHLACLTGDNGQGKSTLLDAMTWALWGKARARRDDDLITHGETEMEVQFEFDLAGERYRVIRRRSAAGRGSSGLELQGRTASGFFASLSEPTIRESQQRITNLLRLDYDTFVNSAFLLQGRADEFTTKKPAERKQILADILGLAQYETLAERAKGKMKVADERRARAETELLRIRDIVAEIPAIEEELVTAEAAANALAAEVREANAALQALFDQRRELDAKGEARTQAELRAKEARGEVARLDGKLAEKRAALARYQALLARATDIEAAQRQLEQARKDKEHWDDLQTRSLKLQTEANGFQRLIDQAQAGLEGELKGVEATIRGCKATLDRYSSRERELAEAQKQVEQLEQLRTRREESQGQLVAQTEANGRLSAENETLKQEMHTLKERMALLEGSAQADCPVCRRPLAADARALALADAQREGKTMGDRYRENQGAMRRVADEVRRTQAAIATADRQLRDLGQWQRRAADAASAATEVRRARQELQEGEQQAATLRARLEAGDFARDTQAQLATLASATASLGYHPDQHAATRRAIQSLAPREAEFRDLAAAREQQTMTGEMVQTLEEQVRLWQEKVAAAEQEAQRLTHELQGREALLRRIQEQQVATNALARDHTIANRRLGSARQKLEHAEQNAARQPEWEAAHHAAIEERTIYDQLAQAFGKRGLQAMLIESAIPDIEREANRLLGRMTDGRMTVALSTQRESRTGGEAIETLDILIADESGERPYEMFSGGEAFRVNFALRIALSRLLAHRAGTSLRTLVMDEGFGSQDAQGRERLVEAITSVQDDFDRILVITHIDELKDAFPVRIDVIKGTNGSRVVVR